MSEQSSEQELIDDVELLAVDSCYSVADVCQICQLSETGLLEYIDYGVVVLEPDPHYRLDQAQLDRLLRAVRLHRDLELNHAGVALALDLLDTIDTLKLELSRIRR